MVYTTGVEFFSQYVSPSLIRYSWGHHRDRHPRHRDDGGIYRALQLSRLSRHLKKLHAGAFFRRILHGYGIARASADRPRLRIDTLSHGSERRHGHIYVGSRTENLSRRVFPGVSGHRCESSDTDIRLS